MNKFKLNEKLNTENFGWCMIVNIFKSIQKVNIELDEYSYTVINESYSEFTICENEITIIIE